MKTKLTLVLSVLLAIGSLAAIGGQAQERQLDRGALLFRLHCASCHGEDGKGDGPMVEHLRLTPADLTALSNRIGGYSEAWLTEVIDGREEVRAHGQREMPVWGMTFYWRSGEQREQDTEAMIDDLVRYVIELQPAKDP